MRIAAAIVASDFTVGVVRLDRLRPERRKALQAASDAIQGEK